MQLIQYVKTLIIRNSAKPKDCVTLYDVMGEIEGIIVPIVEWKKVKVNYYMGNGEWNHCMKKAVKQVIGYRVRGKYGTENNYY